MLNNGPENYFYVEKEMNFFVRNGLDTYLLLFGTLFFLYFLKKILLK
jgi:hypothetical protein